MKLFSHSNEKYFDGLEMQKEVFNKLKSPLDYIFIECHPEISRRSSVSNIMTLQTVS